MVDIKGQSKIVFPCGFSYEISWSYNALATQPSETPFIDSGSDCPFHGKKCGRRFAFGVNVAGAGVIISKLL